MLASSLTWLVRFLHVSGALFWVGGYALIVLVLVPAVRKWPQEPLKKITNTAIRILTYTGLLTIIAGAILIARTRGYGSLFKGEWGAVVIVSIVVALTLMGIGDGALRPALRRLKEPDSKEARRLQLWATIGFILGLIAVASMTRALYATT